MGNAVDISPQEEAKKARRNVCIVFYFRHVYFLKCRQIWSEYDETVAKQADIELEEDFGARKAEYIDVIVSDVRTKNGFNFSVQILNTEGEYMPCPCLCCT